MSTDKRLRRSFDIRFISKDLIEANKNTRYEADLKISDRYECDVEVVVLRVRDRKENTEVIYRDAVGIYRDPAQPLH